MQWLETSAVKLQVVGWFLGESLFSCVTSTEPNQSILSASPDRVVIIVLSLGRGSRQGPVEESFFDL